MTLADIASAAGVSRQTLYLHFGNRAGLLAAVARHLDFKSLAVREMPIAAWEAHSKAGFERFVRLWFKHVAAIFPIANAIEAAAEGDADARAVWEERMDTVRRVIRMMVDGLAESGQLRSAGAGRKQLTGSGRARIWMFGIILQWTADGRPNE